MTALEERLREPLRRGGTCAPYSPSAVYRYDDLFKGQKKTVDDALLDICYLFECPRTSLSVLEELSVSMVTGPLTFTREDGVQTHCSCMGGTRIPEGISKIAVTSGASVNFILVVQMGDVFEDFAAEQFRREFDCVVITRGDGQPDIRTIVPGTTGIADVRLLCLHSATRYLDNALKWEPGRRVM